MADQGRSRQDIWASEAALTLLGPMRLTSKSGENLTPKARKTRAVLAIVALSKGPVSRARLTDLLWGDRGEEQAKASLRQALYELRDLSSSGLLTVSRESVEVGPKRLWTDVGAINAAVDPDQIADQLQEVQWPLLSELDDVTAELDEWLRSERTRVSGQILQEGTKAAESALASGDAATARRIADVMERIDPLHERATQAGIRSDIALGDRSGAHRRLDRLEKRLEEELGLAPSSATRALLDEAPAAKARSSATTATAPANVPHANRRWLFPVLLALLLIAATAVYFVRGTSAEASPNVAILPFEEVGQRTQSYFASGVSDEILNLLSHEQRVRVLGRVSAEEIAERPNSLEIARDLGITHLLDGSVRTAGDRVLVIVNLTRVSDGSQLWSERYERRLGDIFAVQGEIAKTVATRLSRSFDRPIHQSTSPEVYDRYLAARQLVRERREITLREAERLLREAIKLDPRYAPAYAELAQVLMLQSDHPTSYGRLPIDQARAEARKFAEKAIELDPHLGDAYAAMGFIYLQDKRSEPYYRKAAELSPQRADYHRWLATSLSQRSAFSESLVEYRRAVEIDPLWYINNEHYAGALIFVGQEEEARRVARRFMQLSTDDRAKLLLLRGLANGESRAFDSYRYSKMLFDRLPDERNNRFNYASGLGGLGENRKAAEVMSHEPFSKALLSANWAALSREAAAMGPHYWDRSNLWASAALLVRSGHGNVLVRLYDQSKPLIRSGEVDVDLVAVPGTILALSNAGRTEEAAQLLSQFTKTNAKFPDEGLGGRIKEVNLAQIAALSNQRDEALNRLDRLSRKAPLVLITLPSMSLFNSPFYQQFSGDPRLFQADERLRAALNTERLKAGLSTISREDWISDPKTLLTKN
jgi:TolB-like protein/DNA-binding SARP family transcriptional activator/Tfp pilus assembly protein PilF